MTRATSATGRYATVAIVLHWTIAAAILVQLALAWRMDGPPTPEAFAVTQLHKSLGITILFLSVARLAWRLANPPPPMPAGLATWERRLAGATHAAFYVIIIGMPITGWIMVSTARLAMPTVLYGAIPWPHVPGLGDLTGSARGLWNTIGFAGHLTLAWALLLLLPLHVAGALKHQLFSRDEPVLGRMAPGAKPGRWLEPRLLVILAGALAAAAIGLLLRPPEPGVAPPAPVAAAGLARAPAKPGDWTVAPGSTLGFSTAWSGKAIKGRFETWRADITFDPQALDLARIRVEIDLASVTSGDAQRDAVLPGPDWLDAAAHPVAVFAADRIEQTGPGGYVAHGQLTLRGAAHPLDLPFRLTIDGGKAHANGEAVIDRLSFGVGQGDWAKTDQIPAKVGVAIDIVATH